MSDANNSEDYDFELTFADCLVSALDSLARAAASLHTVGASESQRLFAIRMASQFGKQVHCLADAKDSDHLSAAASLHDWPVTWAGFTDSSYSSIAFYLCGRAYDSLHQDEFGRMTGGALHHDASIERLRRDPRLAESFAMPLPALPRAESLGSPVHRLGNSFPGTQLWYPPPGDFPGVYWSPLPFLEWFGSLRTFVEREAEKLQLRPITRPAPLADFLGLHVDEGRQLISRDGRKTEIHLGAAEWATFSVAWRARPDGATRDEWRKAYPDPEPSPSQLKASKSNVNRKLEVLGLRLAPNVDPRIEEIL